MNDAQPRVILVTGLSGAGRTTVLKAFEDCGFEVIDNLPLSLLPLVLDKTSQRHGQLAIGIDIRNRDYTGEDFAANIINTCSQFYVKPTILFLECDTDILTRRYMETRREHPLAKGRLTTDGIEQERVLLQSVKDVANHVVDTSSLTGHELRNWIRHHFSKEADGISLSVMSFSYKNGPPREADIVFDVRFLRNPHYLPDLKPLTGRDIAVSEYVKGDPQFLPFIEQFSTLLTSLLPAYELAGKSFLTIAIGCTGGQHRSVVVAEALAKQFQDAELEVHVFHRELK
ncbi:MAG: RNase adapter RapZ [Alphaproteobacteria bacterium]|nr:RNase adapter RapZ [Alphaproteobacteria bacterium]